MNQRPVFVITANITDTIWLFLMPFVRHLQDRGMEVKIITGKGSYHRELTEAGLDVRDVPFRVSFNPIAVMGMIAKTYKELKSMGTPVAVLTNDPAAAFVTRIAAWLAGAGKVIYFCHGLPWAAHSGLMTKLVYYPLEYMVRPFTDAVITMNEPDYNFCKGVYKRAFKINGVGVDTAAYDKASAEQRFTAREKFSIGTDKKVALFVGRLVMRKGVMDFIEAARIIKNTGKINMTFAMAGSGPLEGEVMSAIKAGSLESTIKLLGYVPDIRDLLPAADALVLPTYYIEGLPRSIQEAMASGIPVVATDVRGCNELIEDGVTGLLVPHQNPRALADAIERLLRDDELAGQLSAKAYERVRREFNILVVIGQFSDILGSLDI